MYASICANVYLSFYWFVLSLSHLCLWAAIDLYFYIFIYLSLCVLMLLCHCLCIVLFLCLCHYAYISSGTFCMWFISHMTEFIIYLFIVRTVPNWWFVNENMTLYIVVFRLWYNDTNSNYLVFRIRQNVISFLLLGKDITSYTLAA